MTFKKADYPNEETKQVIEETDRGENMVEYRTIEFDKKELELFKVKLKLCINDTDIGIEYWKTLYIVDEGGKTPLYIEHNLKMLQDNASVLRCLLEKFKLDELEK